jgi:molybdopterin/thiamine biosynthesis adenylyltransferase
MESQLEVGILTASHPLHLPGYGERRVLAPAAVKRLAIAEDVPAWEVEATALEAEVIPLHYLRNLAEVSLLGQVRLLRSAVAIVGNGAPLERALELLALQGVGRISVVVPAASEEEEPLALHQAQWLGEKARNRNASCEVLASTVRIRGGNPVEAVRGVQVAAAVLPDTASEQLLQFACRMARVPLVLVGAEGNRGQATTVLPGDPGVALVYKPSHPHLSTDRANYLPGPRVALAAGSWITEQVLAVLLETGNLLRSRLLYADLDTGEMAEYPL